MNRPLEALPLTNAVWEATWFSISDLVADASAPTGLSDACLLLVVDMATGNVVGSAVEPVMTPRSFARRLSELLLNPMQGREPERPRELRVTNDVVRKAVRNALGDAIPQVVVASSSPAMQSAGTSIIGYLSGLARSGRAAVEAEPSSTSSVETNSGDDTRAPHDFAATADSPEYVALDLLLELRKQAIESDAAQVLLDRLVWGFFFSTMPTSLGDDEDMPMTYGRFLDWAIFAARPDKETLAEQIVESPAHDLSREALSLRRLLAKPRAGYFKVTRVIANSGFEVIDQQLRDTLRILAAEDTSEIKKGEILVGMLHPISSSHWILSPTLVALPASVKSATAIGKQDIREFAPKAEAELFGASPEWIQTVPVGDVRMAYGDFRKALGAFGTKLPTLNALTKRIAVAAMPLDIVRELEGKVAWWNERELDVFLGFIMRLWNDTPREELGGRSPNEVSMKDMPREQRRASAPVGRRKRR